MLLASLNVGIVENRLATVSHSARVGLLQERTERSWISRPRPRTGTALDRWTGRLPWRPVGPLQACLQSSCGRLKAGDRQPVKAVRRAMSLQAVHPSPSLCTPAAACHGQDKRVEWRPPLARTVKRPMGRPGAVGKRRGLVFRSRLFGDFRGTQGTQRARSLTRCRSPSVPHGSIKGTKRPGFQC